MKALTIAEALGDGAISVPITLWDGLKRTVEGYEVENQQQEVKIAQQDDRAAAVLKELFKYGIENYNSPLEKTIRIILHDFYQSLSESERDKLKTAGAKKIWYVVGKSSASLGLSYSAGRLILDRLAMQGVVKALFKYTMSIELSLLAMQGVLYKAGAASDRLKAKYPRVWLQLKKYDLDMIYFLVERPLQKYMEVMRMKRMHPGLMIIK
jgi:hypothetical protein